MYQRSLLLKGHLTQTLNSSEAFPLDHNLSKVFLQLPIMCFCHQLWHIRCPRATLSNNFLSLCNTADKTGAAYTAQEQSVVNICLTYYTYNKVLKHSVVCQPVQSEILRGERKHPLLPCEHPLRSLSTSGLIVEITGQKTEWSEKQKSEVIKEFIILDLLLS